jgi:hypothetical protein
MARTSASRSAATALLAGLLAAGCRETTVAPGDCPALCPSAQVEVLDTTLTGIVASDSSYRGYVTASEAAIDRLSNAPGDLSAAVVQFFPRPNFWTGTSLLDTFYLASVDSVTLRLTVVQRDTTVDTVRVLVYRAPRPRTIDTATTYDSVTAWVHDSLLVDSIAIPDSLISGAIVHRLPAGAFTPDSADSNIVGAVLVVRSPTPTVVNIAASDFIGQPQLTWYARAADTTQTRVFTSDPSYDSFVQSPEPPAMLADRLFVGNIPAARALLRFDIPRYFIDSTTIVRAVLVLSPVVPVSGAPALDFQLEARGIVRDFGAKSFFTPDLSLFGSVRATVGDTAQIHMTVTNILRTWRGIPPDSLPRSVILRVADEGRTLGELAFAPSTAGSRAPYLKITYIKPYVFGVP